jgi:hypothetical protein
VARFRVKLYREMQQEEPDGEAVVSASDHIQAAARVLREMGGGWADWIRVEQQGGGGSVMCFLDARWVPGAAFGFAYEASYRRGKRGEAWTNT